MSVPDCPECLPCWDRSNNVKGVSFCARHEGILNAHKALGAALDARRSDTQKALDACDKISGSDRLGVFLSRMLETAEAALAKAEAQS